MKSRVTFAGAMIASLLVGIVGTLIFAFFNPFGQQLRTTPISRVSKEGFTLESIYMDLPAHAVAMIHDGDKPMDAFPPGIPLFTEPNIRNGFAAVAKLRDARGTIIGFASELEVISPESNIMQGRLVTDTDWTVVIPGRGTLFLHELEDNSHFAKQVVIPALVLGKTFNGEWTFVNSAGPRPDGRGIIVGGTGEFEGATGSFVEVSTLKRFTPEKELLGTVQLQLEYRIKPP